MQRREGIRPKNPHDIEGKIGIKFRDPRLLATSFVHRSFLNESRVNGLESNERLEFLGDAVIECIVSQHLYMRFAKACEGELTHIRAALVCTPTLSEVAEELGLDAFIFMSRGEWKDFNNGGRQRPRIMASTFESLTGAIQLDQGLEAAELFLSKFLFPKIDKASRYLDPKSYFQELAQERFNVTPSYRILEERGPAHAKHFTVGVYLKERLVDSGEGMSKSEAETNAAKRALKKEFNVAL